MLTKAVEAVGPTGLGPLVIAERNAWDCFMYFAVDKPAVSLVLI